MKTKSQYYSTVQWNQIKHNTVKSKSNKKWKDTIKEKKTMKTYIHTQEIQHVTKQCIQNGKDNLIPYT